mmetsp:Transcript_4328/g.6420  ORF Transcript_4328/g.6420 Transcript_4328/m.6420 type:complete len:152 (-) Transcript_4328:111-566(-)|eukprot:CAMPEP_0203751006 /NCGR_PEP_ID=MMETSP0098-20131031/5145_1 /ASSEMBLY_ACC=CAM_ASM_000208 /TAXON_ID=96639 /ORGANISM=" , Strain NY0313808BC1" /LENGTH=151 /DNA_ID=CAMNT_0050640529 /DNA_START=170 /DNA_END=625 /DNA_ORIENTATION=+
MVDSDSADGDGGHGCMSAETLHAELLSQLEQLKRATSHYRERMSQVANKLNKEQTNFENLKALYDEQNLRFRKLQHDQVCWKNDIEKKREEVRCLKQELEKVTSEWRRSRQAELRNEELEENNKYLERLVITVAVSVPIALLAEKSFRSKL